MHVDVQSTPHDEHAVEQVPSHTAEQFDPQAFIQDAEHVFVHPEHPTHAPVHDDVQLEPQLAEHESHPVPHDDEHAKAHAEHDPLQFA